MALNQIWVQSTQMCKHSSVQFSVAAQLYNHMMDHYLSLYLEQFENSERMVVNILQLIKSSFQLFEATKLLSFLHNFWLSLAKANNASQSYTACDCNMTII